MGAYKTSSVVYLILDEELGLTGARSADASPVDGGKTFSETGARGRVGV